MKLRFKRVGENRGAPLPLPAYANPGDAGFDFRADTDALLFPGQVARIPTGLAPEIPAGYEIQVRPRSGLAINSSITVINSPGTIDSGFRGEIQIGLICLCREYKKGYFIKRGDRIAQGVLAPVVLADIEEVTEVSESVRGTGGLGSTGL